MKKICDTLSRMCNQSIYIIDNLKQEYFYVSPHPLFLCGYTVQDVLKMGYSYYEKIILPEDLPLITEINQCYQQLLFDVNSESRSNFCVSCDFHILHKNGTKVLVNQKVSPVSFTEDGSLWLAIAAVNYSPHKKAGNVVFAQQNKDEYYTYDFVKKKVVRFYQDKLSRREEEIVSLVMRGCDAAEIANMLCISIHTVKNHRVSIERKLGVNNLSNAVSMFCTAF